MIKRLAMVLGCMVVTALLLAAFTDLDTQSLARTRVLGLPTVAVGSMEPAWLSLGVGFGVVVIGLGGAGGVSLTLYGAGLLFATGQLVAGGIAFGQLGFGITHFVGQVGAALTAQGQLVGGAIVQGQVGIGPKRPAFFERMSADLDEILRFR